MIEAIRRQQIKICFIISQPPLLRVSLLFIIKGALCVTLFPCVWVKLMALASNIKTAKYDLVASRSYIVECVYEGSTRCLALSLPDCGALINPSGAFRWRPSNNELIRARKTCLKQRG